MKASVSFGLMARGATQTAVRASSTAAMPKTPIELLMTQRLSWADLDIKPVKRELDCLFRNVGDLLFPKKKLFAFVGMRRFEQLIDLQGAMVYAKQLENKTRYSYADFLILAMKSHAVDLQTILSFQPDDFSDWKESVGWLGRNEPDLAAAKILLSGYQGKIVSGADLWWSSATPAAAHVKLNEIARLLRYDTEKKQACAIRDFSSLFGVDMTVWTHLSLLEEKKLEMLSCAQCLRRRNYMFSSNTFFRAAGVAARVARPALLPKQPARRLAVVAKSARPIRNHPPVRRMQTAAEYSFGFWAARNVLVVCIATYVGAKATLFFDEHPIRKIHQQLRRLSEYATTGELSEKELHFRLKLLFMELQEQLLEPTLVGMEKGERNMLHVKIWRSIPGGNFSESIENLHQEINLFLNGLIHVLKVRQEDEFKKEQEKSVNVYCRWAEKDIVQITKAFHRYPDYFSLDKKTSDIDDSVKIIESIEKSLKEAEHSSFYPHELVCHYINLLLAYQSQPNAEHQDILQIYKDKCIKVLQLVSSRERQADKAKYPDYISVIEESKVRADEMFGCYQVAVVRHEHDAPLYRPVTP